MNIADIEKLTAIFERSSLTRLEYSEDSVRILLSREAAAAPRSALRRVEGGESEPSTEPPEDGGTVVRAPVVGTLFGKKSPDAEPFVKVGSHVLAGDVLCLIEAMKMYSEVEAPAGGVIREICFSDGDLAEFDMPLFVIGSV